MGHDSQRQRNLLGDLGPIRRWQCSKHCLLRLSPPLLLSPISFSFQTYLSSRQHDYAVHCLLISMIMPYTAFISSCLCLSVSMNDSPPTLLIIMLILMCHSCLLLQTLPPQLCSLYTQLRSSYFTFSFYIFTSPKGSSTYLYQASPTDVL